MCAATNHVVTIDEVLENREARVERQRAMLARGGSVVSFTVNMPGPVKDNRDARGIFAAGLEALVAITWGADFPVLEREEFYLVTGPEALLRFGGDALDIKRLTVALEAGHLLGRLFDMDVLGTDGRSVSRSELGLPGRMCLLCEEPASVCGRSRAHTVDELTGAISRMVSEYAAGVRRV